MSINDLPSDLYNGITTANFSPFGNPPDRTLLLIKKARGVANSSPPSFINVPGKLSGPAAFLVFIFFKTFSISDGETSLKLNILPSGFQDFALVQGLYTFQQVLFGNFDSSECKDDPTFVKRNKMHSILTFFLK